MPKVVHLCPNLRAKKITDMNTPIIKIANLKREFIVGTEKVRALKGISFQVFPGDLTFLAVLINQRMETMKLIQYL